MTPIAALLRPLLFLANPLRAVAPHPETPVTWAVDMPSAQATMDANPAMHGTKKIPTTYLNHTATLSAVEVKVLIQVAKSAAGKSSLEAHSSLCFTYGSSVESLLIFTILPDSKPPLEFKATKELVKAVPGSPEKKQACFPANDLPLPSFWSEIQVK